jgi:hypothetical protein
VVALVKNVHRGASAGKQSKGGRRRSRESSRARRHWRPTLEGALFNEIRVCLIGSAGREPALTLTAIRSASPLVDLRASHWFGWAPPYLLQRSAKEVKERSPLITYSFEFFLSKYTFAYLGKYKRFFIFSISWKVLKSFGIQVLKKRFFFYYIWNLNIIWWRIKGGGIRWNTFFINIFFLKGECM